MTDTSYQRTANPASLKQSWRENSLLYANGTALGPYVIWESDGLFRIHAPENSECIESHGDLETAKARLAELFEEWKALSVDYVYFIGRSLSLGEPVKIGTTRHLKRRLGQLNTSSPMPLKLLGAMEGDASDERYMHLRFAEQRLQGEWFAINHELMRLISRNNKKPPILAGTEGAQRQWRTL